MRRTRFLSLCTAAAAEFLTMPLHAESTAAAERAGLPQFDASYFPGQIFWLAVTFTVLYLLMSRLALPRVARTQEKRHEVIAAELAAASAANESAKQIIAAYEKTLADARAEAQATLNDTVRQAAQKLLDRQTEQQHVLTKRLHEAEARIAEARNAALREAQAAISDIAAAALEKIAGAKLQVKP